MTTSLRQFLICRAQIDDKHPMAQIRVIDERGNATMVWINRSSVMFVPTATPEPESRWDGRPGKIRTAEAWVDYHPVEETGPAIIKVQIQAADGSHAYFDVANRQIATTSHQLQSA